MDYLESAKGSESNPLVVISDILPQRYDRQEFVLAQRGIKIPSAAMAYDLGFALIDRSYVGKDMYTIPVSEVESLQEAFGRVCEDYKNHCSRRSLIKLVGEEDLQLFELEGWVMIEGERKRGVIIANSPYKLVSRDEMRRVLGSSTRGMDPLLETFWRKLSVQ
ncbi:hypothetical protein D6817_02930 [Candidatus Pacearchaeota archaeon]|nr:MAG: hypothetical protein D6817_02930 [Candidatus Pacearchaeota archaeon]